MIFLGAGASASFGIPTSTILTNETRNILKDENQKLLDAIDQYFKGRQIEPNYEDFLVCLTVLINPAEINRHHHVHDFARNASQFKGTKNASIRNRIYDLVCRHCTDPFIQGTDGYLNPEDLESKFQMTYDALIGGHLSFGLQEQVFSTNYDPSLEMWCQKRNLSCIDGTQNFSNLEVKKVTDDTSLIEEIKKLYVDATSDHKRLARNDAVALIRLHGSVWTYDVRDKLRIKFTSPQDRRMFPDLYEEVLKMKPVLIFPGQEEKVSRGRWDPLYQYFKEQLSGDCLFVGYSFRHEILDGPILDNLNNGKIKRLVILAPNPNKNLESLSRGANLPNERIVKIAADFGSRDAVDQLVQKWFLPRIPNAISSGYALLNHVTKWRETREREYIR